MCNFSLRLVILFFLSSLCFAEAERITIEVDGIKVGKGGNLMILVFGRDGFPIKHEKALSSQVKQVERISDNRMIFTFDLPAYDEMAFKVLHDEDANNIVTKNWAGLWPGEGLGFSNNAMMGALGSPDFDAAKVSRKEALNGIKIRVTYP